VLSKKNFFGAILLIAAVVVFLMWRSVPVANLNSPSQVNPEGAVSNNVNPALPAVAKPLLVEPVATPEAQAAAQIRVQTLKEIIKSKNDNDPRLDTDFKNLDNSDKVALQEFYKNLANEDRNGRGTVVFLLGKNLSSANDVAFLKTVLTEPPCLNLADCSKANASPSDRSEQHGSPDDVTLVYPKLVALKAIESFLKDEHSTDLNEAISDALLSAAQSPEARVSRVANGLYKANQGRFR
jgi:hypothetical protein